MKRFIFTILLIISCILTVNAQHYDTYYKYFDTYSFGINYARFNETHGSDIYNFKNNQAEVYAVIYGGYIDWSIGFKQYSVNDDLYMAVHGMNAGYLFPLYKKNLKNHRLYAGPVLGFQRVGSFRDNPNKDYIDSYGYYHYGESWNGESTYFNYGGVIAFSYKRLWVQAKATRMQIGGGVGINF